MNRRSRFEIYMDIMIALSESSKNPTRLMNATNLSWAPLRESLGTLVGEGFVQESGNGSSRRTYALTQKGHDAVRRYKELLRDVAVLTSAQSEGNGGLCTVPAGDARLR